MPFGHNALPSCLRDTIYSWIFQGAKKQLSAAGGRPIVDSRILWRNGLLR
jgi:hypothetical protein